LTILQSLREQLVHLGHLSRHGKINGAVGNLDNDAATNLGVDFGHRLDRLALEHIVRLGNRTLQAAQRPVVQRRSARNHELDLAAVRAHELAKLGHDARQRAQTVVFRERGEQILDDSVLVGRANVLLQFLDDLLLVRDREGGGVEDFGELGVLFEDAGKLVERLGRGVERIRLRGCRVLESRTCRVSLAI